MLTKVAADNSMVRIGRVLSVSLVALIVGWVATAVAGSAEDLVNAARNDDAAAVKALLAKGFKADNPFTAAALILGLRKRPP
jgi:hypothetical protein